MLPSDSSFWQYKVYVDIRGGFPADGASNDSGVIENFDSSSGLQRMLAFVINFLSEMTLLLVVVFLWRISI